MLITFIVDGTTEVLLSDYGICEHPNNLIKCQTHVLFSGNESLFREDDQNNIVVEYHYNPTGCVSCDI